MHELFHVSFYASKFMAIIMYLVTHIMQLQCVDVCFAKVLRATSHTRPRALTITLQTLTSVEKAEPVQVRFTL